MARPPAGSEKTLHAGLVELMQAGETPDHLALQHLLQADGAGASLPGVEAVDAAEGPDEPQRAWRCELTLLARRCHRLVDQVVRQALHLSLRTFFPSSQDLTLVKGGEATLVVP